MNHIACADSPSPSGFDKSSDVRHPTEGLTQTPEISQTPTCPRCGEAVGAQPHKGRSEPTAPSVSGTLTLFEELLGDLEQPQGLRRNAARAALRQLVPGCALLIAALDRDLSETVDALADDLVDARARARLILDGAELERRAA